MQSQKLELALGLLLAGTAIALAQDMRRRSMQTT
jgi:hypothetical protein